MIETGEILQTMRMIQEENFDIRTITLGINLLDCSDPDAENAQGKFMKKYAGKRSIWFRPVRKLKRNSGFRL